MNFTGRGILLDIEGTTSSVSFVVDVMFPYVRRELEDYLRGHWGHQDVAQALERTAKDLGHDSLGDWCVTSRDVPTMCADVFRLMDGDVKATGLKALQGLVWQTGFANGELQSQVYDDVVPTLQAWNTAGLDVRIYSSGSIQAQKLFFSHTTRGNLLKHFRNHYDTTTGSKKEAASYTAIAAEYSLPAEEILFLSDLVAELDAARAAGLQTGLLKRPGNAPVAEGHGHPEIASFKEIVIPTTK
ncbi:MAG TPA: acireductone synthase [Pirellulaceae bacterium]|nr:acireductone synthase [Pirellulaceae bacterium]